MKGSFMITAACTIQFDEGICYVTKDGQNVPAKIKGKQYRLLRKLFENRNQTVTYEIIFETLWENEEYMPETAYKRMNDYISKLRTTLRVDSSVIENIYHTGYIFHYDGTAGETAAAAPEYQAPQVKTLPDLRRNYYGKYSTVSDPIEKIEELIKEACGAKTEPALIWQEKEIWRIIEWELPSLEIKQIDYIERLIGFYVNQLANRTDALGRDLEYFLERGSFQVTVTKLRVQLHNNEIQQEIARKQGDKRWLNRLIMDHDWLEEGLNLVVGACQYSYQKRPEKEH